MNSDIFLSADIIATINTSFRKNGSSESIYGDLKDVKSDWTMIVLYTGNRLNPLKEIW